MAGPATPRRSSATARSSSPAARWKAGNNLSQTIDIYDPTNNTVTVPNGDMLFAARDAAVALIQTGRPIFFDMYAGNAISA